MSAPRIGDEVRFDYTSATVAWSAKQIRQCNHTGTVVEIDGNWCRIERTSDPLLGEKWAASAHNLIVVQAAS